MTTSSLRLAKWLTEYAHLMRVIRSDAGRIWSGMAELFELCFLHTFHTFGDITIAALMSTQQQRQASDPHCLVTLAADCGGQGAVVSSLLAHLPQGSLPLSTDRDRNVSHTVAAVFAQTLVFAGASKSDGPSRMEVCTMCYRGWWPVLRGMGVASRHLMDVVVWQGGMDIVPVRLRNAVLRIVARSKHRAYYLPQKEQPPGASTPAHVRALTSAFRHLRKHTSPASLHAQL